MQTPLDAAWQSLQAKPDDTTARLRYFERVMDAELFLPLADADNDNSITPVSVKIEDEELVLAFDLELRLSDQADGTANYITVSGRGLVEMLVDQGAGILLNRGCDSENTLPPDTIAWLAQMSGIVPDEVDESPEEILPPAGIDESLIIALDAKFSTMRGLADHAVLVLAKYADGTKRPLVAIMDPIEAATPDIAQAVTEAAQFSGAELASVDLVFLPADHTAAQRMDQVGLKFQIPRPDVATQPAMPGSDPSKPPKLR